MYLLTWLIDYMSDVRTWLPSLAAGTALALFIQERRKKKLEVEKLREEVRKLKEEPSRLYRPTGKEVDEILEKIHPFSVRIQRFMGTDTPFQEFAPRLNEFIVSYVSQDPPPDPEPVLRDWKQVRREAAERLGNSSAEEIDFFLKLAVRAKQFKSSVALDLNAYRNRNEQLGEAVRDGLREQVASLLDQGASPDGNAGAEEVPIISAVRSGDAGICQALLAAGADPNRAGGQRRTALMIAAREGHAAVVRCLLSNAKTNVNAADQAGLTALMHAINGKHAEVIRLLLDARADPTIKDENQQTALSRAIKNKDESLQALLRQAGASE